MVRSGQVSILSEWSPLFVEPTLWRSSDTKLEYHTIRRNCTNRDRDGTSERRQVATRALWCGTVGGRAMKAKILRKTLIPRGAPANASCWRVQPFSRRQGLCAYWLPVQADTSASPAGRLGPELGLRSSS